MQCNGTSRFVCMHVPTSPALQLHIAAMQGSEPRTYLAAAWRADELACLHDSQPVAASGCDVEGQRARCQAGDADAGQQLCRRNSYQPMRGC